MSDVERVQLAPAERRVFLTLSILLALIALAVVHLNWFRIDHSFRSYPKDALLAAKLYVDSLPASSAPTLFATNGRNFQPFGGSVLAEQGIKAFMTAQAATYVIGLWRIDVFVLPGLLQASAMARQQMLSEAGARGASVQAIANIADASAGCVAQKSAPFGWTDGGFVLVDPTLHGMAPEQAIRCISAGLAFINGLPVSGDAFDILEAPSAATSAIVLDFVMRCAYAGITEANPPLRSRSGISSKPSISCVRDSIADAINGSVSRR